MSGFAATGNDEPGAEDAGPSVLTVSEETMDNVTDTLHSVKATRVMVGANGSRHSAVYATPTGPITARLEGVSSKRAAALFIALERLLNGAYVFDGDDLAIIRDGMRIARSEISGLAPEQQSATNALGFIETALSHLEVVS